jgi:SAM-dependent methyltransferase
MNLRGGLLLEIDKSVNIQFAPQEWSRARRKLVIALLNRYKPENELLDIGCGPGEPWPEYHTTGIDSNPDVVHVAKQHGSNAFVANALELPFKDGVFGVVLMMDVLEHLTDDSKALSEVLRVLKQKGILVIAVPLYPFFWSKHDIHLGHVRRYKPKALGLELKKLGFTIKYRSCWNFLGLPGALIRKMGIAIDDASNLAKPFLFCEAYFASYYSLPLGLSEFWVVEKSG